MTPYSSGSGCRATRLTANAGILVGAVGVAAAQQQGCSALKQIRSIVLGGDSTATTVTIYDALSATGTPKWVLTTQANFGPQSIGLDAELDVGLYIVTAGVTTGSVTAQWTP